MGEVCRIGNSKIHCSCQGFAWANCMSPIRTTHWCPEPDYLWKTKQKQTSFQMPSIFSFSLKLWYFFKKKFYWCKALGPVNLEQTSKMVIKTTTVIKTDERKTNGCYRKVLQNKTSVKLQEINISFIKLQLIITGKKIKAKKYLLQKQKFKA